MDAPPNNSEANLTPSKGFYEQATLTSAKLRGDTKVSIDPLPSDLIAGIIAVRTTIESLGE